MVNIIFSLLGVLAVSVSVKENQAPDGERFVNSGHTVANHDSDVPVGDVRGRQLVAKKKGNKKKGNKKKGNKKNGNKKKGNKDSVSVISSVLVPDYVSGTVCPVSLRGSALRGCFAGHIRDCTTGVRHSAATVFQYCSSGCTTMPMGRVDYCNADSMPALSRGSVCKSGGVTTGIGVNRQYDCPIGNTCMRTMGTIAIGGEVAWTCQGPTVTPSVVCATQRSCATCTPKNGCVWNGDKLGNKCYRGQACTGPKCANWPSDCDSLLSSWPSTLRPAPTYGLSCTQHSQCDRVNEYCYSCNICPRGQCGGCSSAIAGICGLISQCPIDNDSITGHCPSSSDMRNAPDIRTIMGRPFTLLSGESLVAPSHQNTSDENEMSWCQPGNMDVAMGMVASSASSATTAAAHAHWVATGLAEHASVASFSRFSLQLMAVSAPAFLVQAAHTAAMDEIKHAQLSFALANGAFGAGGHSTPGAFTVPGGLISISDNPADIARSTFLEGCVGETVSTVRAAFEAAMVLTLPGEPAVAKEVRTVMKIITTDEARHANLGWRTIQWLLSPMSPDTAGAKLVLFEEMKKLQNELKDLPSHAHTKGKESLPLPLSVGLDLPVQTSRVLRSAALQQIILPRLQALLAMDASAPAPAGASSSSFPAEVGEAVDTTKAAMGM